MLSDMVIISGHHSDVDAPSIAIATIPSTVVLNGISYYVPPVPKVLLLFSSQVQEAMTQLMLKTGPVKRSMARKL